MDRASERNVEDGEFFVDLAINVGLVHGFDVRIDGAERSAGCQRREGEGCKRSGTLGDDSGRRLRPWAMNVREKNDIEFEALGVVHGHQPHGDIGSIMQSVSPGAADEGIKIEGSGIGGGELGEAGETLDAARVGVGGEKAGEFGKDAGEGAAADGAAGTKRQTQGSAAVFVIGEIEDGTKWAGGDVIARGGIGGMGDEVKERKDGGDGG
jgi:hypothetical protein